MIDRKFLLLVIFLASIYIGISLLINLKNTGAEILFISSLCNLCIALGIAVFSNQNIIPKQPKLQIGTFICIGLGLLLNLSAYQYISAGSVSTLQRLDIPLLVIVAALNRKSSLRQTLLALLSFTLVAALLILNKTTNEKPTGYLIVFSAVIILCINTLLQKKIAVTENIQTIIIISSLSSVFWSGIRCWQTHSTFSNIHFGSFFAIVGLSIVNVFVFYLVNDLYKKYNPEVVRYPYLLAAFLTLTTEMLVEHKLFNSILIIGNISILIVLTLLVRDRQKNFITNETQ